MDKTQAQTVDVDIGRAVFNPERKSLIAGGKEYELTTKQFDAIRNVEIGVLNADPDVASTKAELEAEIPTFTQATAMMEDDG